MQEFIDKAMGDPITLTIAAIVAVLLALSILKKMISVLILAVILIGGAAVYITQTGGDPEQVMNDLINKAKEMGVEGVDNIKQDIVDEVVEQAEEQVEKKIEEYQK